MLRYSYSYLINILILASLLYSQKLGYPCRKEQQTSGRSSAQTIVDNRAGNAVNTTRVSLPAKLGSV